MLESVSERLLLAGGAHDNAPDKKPAVRLRTLEMAGKLAHSVYYRNSHRHR